MNARKTLYWRTHAGVRAWASAASGLPAHYRAILGALQAPAAADELSRALGAGNERELRACLAELETLGFIQTARAAAAYYLEAA